MEAVILAAGEGRRLRPLTTYYPKPMMPVGNKPILEWIITALRISGITNITIVVGYQKDKIIRYFGDGKDFGVDIDYVIQEKQLGTAHALSAVGSRDDFILLPGDNLVDPLCIEKIKKEKNTILTTISDMPSKYGVIVREGTKVRIIEKENIHGNAQVFTGIGHFDANIFRVIEKAMSEEIYDLPQIISSMDNLKVVTSSCTWLDAVYPWDLLNLNWYALKSLPRRIEGKIERSEIIGQVEIGKGTIIGAGSYIKGPVVIGENCVIGPNTVIMPGVSIGDGSEIGAHSYIERSIIMRNVTVGVGVRMRNSVIANGVTIEDGSILLSGNVRRIVEDEIFNFESVGAILGDGAYIGAGSVIAPGVLVGADVNVGALKTIFGDVKNGEKVI